MADMSIWQVLLIGGIAALVLFMFGPGVRRTLEESRNAPKDWPAVILPLGLVILFVLFLIAMVR